MTGPEERSSGPVVVRTAAPRGFAAGPRVHLPWLLRGPVLDGIRAGAYA